MSTSTSDRTKVVPLRQQYLQIKARYPDTILFFRLGDFYETFDDDARIASEVLDIVLTGREMGKDLRVPMAGIPYHSADGYIEKPIDTRRLHRMLKELSPDEHREHEGVLADALARVQSRSGEHEHRFLTRRHRARRP